MHLYQHNLTSSSELDRATVTDVATWIHEVITPLMIGLSCLVLSIAAIILLLLVKHYRYETSSDNITVTQVLEMFTISFCHFIFDCLRMRSIFRDQARGVSNTTPGQIASINSDCCVSFSCSHWRDLEKIVRYWSSYPSIPTRIVRYRASQIKINAFIEKIVPFSKRKCAMLWSVACRDLLLVSRSVAE